MRIRHAVPEDLKELARIEAASYPAAEAASLESIRARMEVFPECFWLMEEKGKILGFINGMAANETELTDEMYDHAKLHNPAGKWQMLFSVVTAPEYRKQGVASRIMEQVIADTKNRGRQGIVLTCKKQLIPFYARFGYGNEGVSGSVHGGAVWYQMRMEF